MILEAVELVPCSEGSRTDVGYAGISCRASGQSFINKNESATGIADPGQAWGSDFAADAVVPDAAPS